MAPNSNPRLTEVGPEMLIHLYVSSTTITVSLVPQLFFLLSLKLFLPEQHMHGYLRRGRS